MVLHNDARIRMAVLAQIFKERLRILCFAECARQDHIIKSRSCWQVGDGAGDKVEVRETLAGNFNGARTEIDTHSAGRTNCIQ